MEQLLAETMDTFRPRKKITGSEWADEYAYLSPESSAEVGKWTCFPYQREILDTMTDLRTERVVLMKSARIGYTKMCDITMGYFIHQDPCNIVMYQPTEQDAEDYSKDDIAPMIRDTPALTPLVSEEKSRSAANTLRKKMFPGGQLVLAGANSPTGFRRITMRVAMFDEVDGYPPTAGKEGDQIYLGIRRTETYWNRKIIIGSTPTVQGDSKIEKHFTDTDQRRYFVPCPFCGHMQALRWQHIKWEAGQPETARYECEECAMLIDHSMKAWMMERGEWRPTAEGKPHYRGYHIWAGYSYHPNSTWADLAAEFEEVNGKPEQLKTFVNTVLGETWKDKGEAPEWENLYERREDYERNIVPMGGVVLTAFADVQKDRIEVEIAAWGKNHESWSIDYRVFIGDTATLDSACWKDLKRLLSEQWKHAGGGGLMIEKLGVDSGYNTQTVYAWIRKQDHVRVVCTKGAETAPSIINQPRAVEVRESGKRISRGVRVWTIGTNTAKSELYGWLRQHRDPEAETLPHGWCHFPEYYDSEYFKQLTAEQTVAKVVKGYRRYYWEKTRERNEALDCRVGNRAMAQLIGIDRWNDAEWERRLNLYLTKEIEGKTKPAKKRRESSFWG